MDDFFAHPVVCNAGPVIALARAGMGRLLHEVFPRVLVPETVVAELQEKEAGDADEIARVLAVAEIVSLPAPPEALLLHELDAGEAAVIHSAMTMGTGRVLLDDRKARRIAAAAYNLEVRGTGALLIAAKARGLITQVRPILEAMRGGGYFIGAELMAECLRRAGE